MDGCCGIASMMSSLMEYNILRLVLACRWQNLNLYFLSPESDPKPVKHNYTSSEALYPTSIRLAAERGDEGCQLIDVYSSPGICPSNIDGLWLGLVHWHHDSQWCTQSQCHIPHQRQNYTRRYAQRWLNHWCIDLMGHSTGNPVGQVNATHTCPGIVVQIIYALPKCLNELGSYCTDVGSRVRKVIKAGMHARCMWLLAWGGAQPQFWELWLLLPEKIVATYL